MQKNAIKLIRGAGLISAMVCTWFMTFVVLAAFLGVPEVCFYKHVPLISGVEVLLGLFTITILNHFLCEELKKWTPSNDFKIGMRRIWRVFFP